MVSISFSVCVRYADEAHYSLISVKPSPNVKYQTPQGVKILLPNEYLLIILATFDVQSDYCRIRPQNI